MGGYFNLGGNWSGYEMNHEIGARVFFHADGTGQLDINDPVMFTYNLDEWNDINFIVDLDAHTKSMYINDNLIADADPWDAPSGFGLVNMIGIAYNTFGLSELVTPGIYFDDVELNETSPVSTSENNTLDQKLLFIPLQIRGDLQLS